MSRLKNKIRDLEDITYDNTSDTSKKSSDPNIQKQILEQQAQMINQLTALDVTTAEHVRTLKSLTNMKDQAFFKIGELKYAINHFQEEVKKNQIMNEKT